MVKERGDVDWREWFDEVQAPLGAVVVEERHDEIGPVQLIERGGQRLMYFNTSNCQGRGWQNVLEQPASEYHPSILLSAALPVQMNKALVLGLGAGALPAGLLASFPDAEIHAVELRGIVAEISYEVFGLPRSPQLHVHVEDAAEYLRRWEEQAFDLIMVDLALGEGVSPLLLTEDFWSLCAGALAPGGVLSANLWQGEQHSYSVIASLMRSVSPQGLCWLEHRSIGNIVLSSLPSDFEATDFLKRAVAMSGGIRRDLLPLGHQIYRQIRREQHLQESPGERITDSKCGHAEGHSRDEGLKSRGPSMVWRSQPTRSP
ncbi:MAG: hypothetical protein VYD19_02870, partial [Myxococcota bacterium]|nr:hypothetical protein [Myxococcota bacterium]